MNKFVLALSIIFLGVVFSPKVEAKIIDKNYQRTFVVNDSNVEITESKSITINQNNYFIQAGAEENFVIYNPIKDDPEAESKAQKTLASISVVDNFGNQLKFSSETTPSGNLILKPQVAVGIYSSNTYTITLKYTSFGIISKSGAVRDLYIPGVAKYYIFEDEQSIERINTKVIIPKSFGEINILKPQVTINNDSDKFIIDFNQEDLRGVTAWIQIRNIQYYNFSLEQPYSASAGIPIVFNRFKLILPRNIKSGPITQEVFFTKITPEPYSTELDSNGNLIATFKVAVNESGSIKIDGYAVINQNNSVNIADSGELKDISVDLINSNTASAKFWEADAQEIVDVAKSLKGEETNVYKLVENAYRYVINKIDYSEVKKFGLNARQGALVTLRGGAAVCMEYSDLFIAIVRAMGIPARAAFGVGYSALDGLTSSVNTVNHQWAEVYIPKANEWISVDTTWGENGDDVIGGDLNHFYTHIASINPEIPSVAEALLYGKDGEFKDREIKVYTTEVKPEVESINQNQLLEKYPKKDPDNSIIENFIAGVSLLFVNINKPIDEALQKTPLPAELFFLPKLLIVLIIGFAIYFIRSKLKKRFTKKNETVHTN